MRMRAAITKATCGILSGCAVLALAVSRPPVEVSSQTPEPEAISLLGKPLYSSALPPATREKLEANLAAAKVEYDRNPNDPEKIIWLGRRTAYLGRFREAIRIYSEGIAKHPRSHKLYRHRGHRYLTVREIDKAAADLEKAAQLIRGVPDEVEPDGAPNPKNIPTSTSHTNIWYHLGLAYYLKGDFEKALRCYRESMTFAKNDDMRAATADWMYMTLRRLGRNKEAQKLLATIREDMNIIENFPYFNRLLLYKGQKTPESLLNTEGSNATEIATLGYGVGNWFLYTGNKEKAREIFEKVVAGTAWPAFGHLATEAELKRLR